MESSKSSMFELEMSGLSKAREAPNATNHDAMAVLPTDKVIGVFDGTGPSQLAASISRLAARQLHTKRIRDLLDVDHNQEQVDLALFGVIIAIRSRIRTLYGEDLCGERTGTTAEVAKHWVKNDGTPMLSICHIGDSRTYLRRNNKLRLLTLDHNLPMESFRRLFGNNNLSEFLRLLDEGTTDDMKQFIAALGTEDDFLRIPYACTNFLSKCLTNGSRQEPSAPDIFHIELEPDDEIFLMTDGVSGNLSIRQIQTVLNFVDSLRVRIHRLVREARKVARNGIGESLRVPAYRRLGPDDMTVAAMKITKRADSPSSLLAA